MVYVETSSGRWAPFCATILDFLKADTVDLTVDGVAVRGFRSPDSPALWIRDHSDMLRGGKFFMEDVRSAVEAFAGTQDAGGRIFDFVSAKAGAPPLVRENWETWVRVPVEADVEYRFVKAGYLAWQATGDEDWLRRMLPAFDGALRYSITHPWRWDQEHQLVKRAYTIDTWDFDYTAGRAPWLNFQITDDTFWGIMHGDNSGFFEAALRLADLHRVVGDAEAAELWTGVAHGVRERANALLFNGRFYTHFHKLTPVTIEGVDEAEQLSLSNPMDINRGLASHDIAVSILREYQRRRVSTGAFAEWFSIDPPFPDGIFGDPKLVGGAYCNGGIMPLVGGELARAAFEHGFEAYGIEILDQYRTLIGDAGETYLWYFPDGRPATVETSTSPDSMPTDGWGSSAMLHAFLEGLCGIEDRSHSFRHVQCAPRWAATDETEAAVRLQYAASGASFGYRFAHRPDDRRIVMTLEGRADEVRLHVLLPNDAVPSAVYLNGRPLSYDLDVVEGSRYVNSRHALDSRAEIEITYDLG